LGLTAQTFAPAPAHHATITAISAASPASAQDQAAQESKTFTGKVAQSSEGKFVLEDTSSNTTYKLDDQEKVKAFNGKNVKVTGTLDPHENMIHVVDIQEA